MVNMFRKMAAPLERRIMLMVGRAVVRLVNDGPKMQELQLATFADEVRDKVERFQNYGLTSVPFAGAEAAVVFVGGDCGHGIAVVVDDRRYRPKNLQPGESAHYDDQGQMIHLKRGKKVHIYGCDELIVDAAVKVTVTSPEVVVNASTKVTVTTPQLIVNASTSVTLTTPLLAVSGNITAGGNISDAGGTKSMSGMRSTFNTHTHSHPADGVTIPAPGGQM
jgi:phage baseplate assembly protein V